MDYTEARWGWRRSLVEERLGHLHFQDVMLAEHADMLSRMDLVDSALMISKEVRLGWAKDPERAKSHDDAKPVTGNAEVDRLIAMYRQLEANKQKAKVENGS